MWKSDWKIDKRWFSGKEKWLVLLACGLLLLVFPVPFRQEEQNGSEASFAQEKRSVSEGSFKEQERKQEPVFELDGEDGGRETDALACYEKELEKRVEEILKQVDGVGEVDVMILLRSSGEKIVHMDQEKSRTSTEETDHQGGNRSVMTEDISQSSLLGGEGGERIPFIEKELRPEIAGIVISAEGGGSTLVKAEISEAMEALFGLPAHKIKVLKRVE